MLKALKFLVGIKYSFFSLFYFGSFVFFIFSCSLVSEFSRSVIIKHICYGIPAAFSARAFGMIINQIIDYDFDKKNERTRMRALPSKMLSMRFSFLCSGIFLLILLFFSFCISFICFMEACCSVILMILYPYVKRVHICCHFVLGCVYVLSIIMIGEAIFLHFNIISLIYAVMVGLLISANDIVYAVLDKEFDKQEKLFSFPAVLGEQAAVITVYVCYGISLFLLFFIGIFSCFSIYYYILSGIFALLLLVLSIKIQATLNRYSYKFISWENAFFFANFIISLSLFILFFICFIMKAI